MPDSLRPFYRRNRKEFPRRSGKENSGAVQPARPRCHPLYGAVPDHGYFSRFPKKHPNQTAIQVLEGDTTYLTEALIHGSCSMAFLRDSDLHPLDDTVFEKVLYEGSARHPASVRPSEGSFRKHLPKRVIRRRFCDLKSGHVAASALSLSLRFLWFPAEHRPGMQTHGLYFDLVSQHMGISC